MVNGMTFLKIVVTFSNNIYAKTEEETNTLKLNTVSIKYK
jgi:hypothetical protein